MHLDELVIALKKRREKALESKKSNPTLETLTKLADVLGMELKLEVKKPEL